ncbi:endogenous retrovirus group K member 10 Gag polyprotein-like [Meriones unguiculatus]|uniref:endogenous retrovirus group K member 10 Gag polyprotein-like n=1 Tax=Meriones unguiculatus TaxID=10047 RepID=UPI00293EEA1F|nr:endogenous retrovirus group K member 10 Gag polyprotein-like [Meriones unguiculatus]
MWDRVGTRLRGQEAGATTFALWALINEALKAEKSDADTKESMDSVRAHLQEVREEKMSQPEDERMSQGSSDPDDWVDLTETKKEKEPQMRKKKNFYGSAQKALQKIQEDNTSEEEDLDTEDEADLEEEIAKYPNPDWPLPKAKGPPSYKELVPLKQTKKRYDFMSPIEQVIDSAKRKGEDFSEFPMAYPVVEVMNPQGNRIRQHVSIELKQLKELKTAVSQYGTTAPFTVALFETIADNNLTPLDWKTVARAVLSGGDYLLWSADFREFSRRTATLNVQSGNPAWNQDMLLGEGQYEGNYNQINYPPAVYTQITAAARRAWQKLPSKGKMSSALASIKQESDEPFQEFVDRLLKAAGRIFGDPEGGIQFVQQLAFENANSACKAAIRPYRTKTDLSGYICLCADIGPAYQQGFAMAAALKGVTVQETFMQRNKQRGGCFNCGQTGHIKRNCPMQSQPRSPGICPRCKRGKHWANKCKSKFDKDGQPIQAPRQNDQTQNQGNGKWGQPRAANSQHEVYGAMKFVPQTTSNPFLPLSEQPQEVQDWTSVPPPTQY